MQNWTELYTELSNKINQLLPEVKWIDLWHNQVSFLVEEHPFPTPAVFLSFRTQSTEDVGMRVQKAVLQIDVYLFYETFADTYRGSHNQESALAFLELLSKINAVLHASAGKSYSNMRRLGFSPVDTGGSGNTYMISYSCELLDYSAMLLSEDVDVEELDISAGSKPDTTDDEPIYHI